MDIFTKGVLWDYWKMRSDDTELTNENGSDLEDECSSDMNETTEIFKIEDNLIDYETPLWKLEEPWSENRIPYQLCDHICEPYRFKNEITKWPTYSSNIDGFCNGGELPGMVRVRCMTYFQDKKWYDELTDGKLKVEALTHKARIEEFRGIANSRVMNSANGPRCKEIDEVGKVSIIWNPMCDCRLSPNTNGKRGRAQDNFPFRAGGVLLSKDAFRTKNARATYQRLVDKGCLDKKDFTWTIEADKAFEEMKRYIEKLPTLAALKSGENLIIYLAASKECIKTKEEDEETDFKEKQHAGQTTRWKLYTDGASSGDGFGAGLMVADVLSNLASLTFKHLTKEVLVEKSAKKSIHEKQVAEAIVEEENSWMTPIIEYLVSGILPAAKKLARKVRVKAPNYRMIDGILYKRSFLTSWLRCVGSRQADDIK
ncbi:hypothetical protein Tco_0216925 [Tanacetum coccineum]